MATVPQPRSYNQILGDLIDGFQSRFGVDNLRVGSPILSILEAAAQSDLRSSQDIFAMLNSISLDRAEGDALDRIGADEDLPRASETFASGLVNIGDSSFAKKSTKVYVGKPAPIVGTVTLFVADAASFPTSGQVYIGRGTANFEGPLAYTAATAFGTYWTLTLSTPTQKFHNLNEVVVLGQGGNRVIAAGSVVQTQQGNVAEAIQFATLYAANVPDGEILITGVQVVARKPGTIGDVPGGAIKEFASPPFTGATVTNPLPYINALPAEDDRSYRERIRNARQSRAKGTPLAIETGVLGTVASDENKSVLSASVVTRQGFPTTLYIDDGTGYEEITTGVAIESIIADATGGEQYFQVNNRPVAKAFVETTIDEPFTLSAGAKLGVKVNGIAFYHTFSAEEFRNINNATAFEVVASINADDSLPFDARLSSNGNRVAIFADADTQEDVEVVAVLAPDLDANTALVFTLGQVQTTLLYLNDRLLTKDGRLALLSSNPQASWAPAFTTPATLLLDVDGTGQVIYTITGQDFINQQTGYTTVSSSNSLAAWVKVFNARLPGVSAEISGNSIVLVSNLGPDSRARVKINGGTLVTDGMFSVSDSIGLSQDYTLDRNTGQFRLEESLNLGDTLALGTAATRAFVQSGSIATTTLVTNALQWWVIDGGAVIISSGMTPGSVITIADYNPTPINTWGDRVRVSAATGTPFNHLAIGDWAIFYDTALAGNNQGAWRVAYVDAGGTYFEIERPTAGWTPQASLALIAGGIKFVRTAQYLQLVSIPTGTNYTAASFVDAINADLRGATAEIYRTTRIRVRTNTFAIDGDIALVAQNAEAEKLAMGTGDAIDNLTSHLGVVVGSQAEFGTPEFIIGSVSSAVDADTFVRTGTDPALSSGHHVVFRRPTPDQDTGGDRDRYGNAGFHSPVESQSGTTINLRNPVLQEVIPTERFYAGAPFAIGPEDLFTAVIDENEQNQRYVLPMYRRLKPTTASYGLSNFFTDADNANASLALAFGLGYDFKDFSAWMKARTKTHNESGDTNKTILYRYYRFGPEGDLATLAYTYPAAASLPVAVTTTDYLSGSITVGVSLPSGAAKTGFTVRNTTKIGVMSSTGPGVIQTWTYILGYSVSSATRVTKLNFKSQTVNYTVGLTVTGGTSGATGVISSQVDAGTTGTLTLTAVTGTFLDGELVTDTGGGSATANGSQYGYTTLTLDIATPGASAHGFSAGNVLYLASTNINFSSGLKTLDTVGGGFVTYVDSSATAVAATPNIGTISYDTGEATLTGSTVAVNDIASVTTPQPSFLNAYARPTRITSFGAQYWKGVSDSLTITGTVPTWAPLTSTAYLSFFPLNAGTSTIIAIAASVNALAAAPNSVVPITAVAVGTGIDTSGVITQASYDEFNTVAGKNYVFTDGLNWVRSQVNPILVINNYQFTFKDAITATLASNSDWANEEVRLVPVTTKNVVDWFNTEGVSGLGSAAENARAEDGDRPQISTLLPGSTGGVRVQGGTANAVSVPVVGSAANVAALYSQVTVKTSDAVGIRGRQWVTLQNTATMPKQVFAAGSVVSSITTGGVFTLDATSSTNLWNWANTATGAVAGFTWQVEQQGRYISFVWDGIGAAPNLAGVQEGDWVSPLSGSGTLNSRNCGNFRVIRISNAQKVFWVENTNALEERGTVDLVFRTYDSAMVGDTLVINTSIFGSGNVGSWTVAAVSNSNVKQITLDVSARPMQAFAGPLALGAQSSLMQIFEGAPTKLVKRVRSVSPNATSGFTDVKFETLQGYRQVSVVAGTLIQSLDKLAFDTDLFLGVDGYRYSAGLIQEVNRVAYGDPSDTAAYPGIIAAGAQVNIQGPLIRRITCSLALRLKSGANVSDIIEAVRSAVASVINNTGVGEPIAISDIITAAGSVTGVVAVTVLSPTFTVGNDLISIQPFEKPLVLDLVADISVALVSD